MICSPIYKEQRTVTIGFAGVTRAMMDNFVLEIEQARGKKGCSPMDDEKRDRYYMRGAASVYREMLNTALRGLGRPAMPVAPDELGARVVALEAELAEARAQIGILADDIGVDVDLDPDLHLADVVKNFGDAISTEISTEPDQDT